MPANVSEKPGCWAGEMERGSSKFRDEKGRV